MSEFPVFLTTISPLENYTKTNKKVKKPIKFINLHAVIKERNVFQTYFKGFAVEISPLVLTTEFRILDVMNQLSKQIDTVFNLQDESQNQDYLISILDKKIESLVDKNTNEFFDHIFHFNSLRISVL